MNLRPRPDQWPRGSPATGRPHNSNASPFADCRRRNTLGLDQAIQAVIDVLFVGEMPAPITDTSRFQASYVQVRPVDSLPGMGVVVMLPALSYWGVGIHVNAPEVVV